MNTIGQSLNLTIFGESHGPVIGCVIDGLPAGESVDTEFIEKQMKRRAPGRFPWETARKEEDQFEILSGVLNGRTEGTPLAAVIFNRGQHSKDYDKTRFIMRPGHADYTGNIKYGGWEDSRGGGHFSGRLTAPLVFAGALAQSILAKQGIHISAHILQVGSVLDTSYDPMGMDPSVWNKLREKDFPVLSDEAGQAMKDAIAQAKRKKDSLGGAVECMAEGVPAGWGSPFFDSLESSLAHMMFSIPAVKGISFGDGFDFASMRGKDAMDPLAYQDGRVVTEANHNGGINGGISNGMPILFRTAFKPVASIGMPQQTIDISEHKNTVLTLEGRHDPCIVPRAAVVVETAAAFVLLDAALERKRDRL
jgi:chorismate synthase